MLSIFILLPAPLPDAHTIIGNPCFLEQEVRSQLLGRVEAKYVVLESDISALVPHSTTYSTGMSPF